MGMMNIDRRLQFRSFFRSPYSLHNPSHFHYKNTGVVTTLWGSSEHTGYCQEDSTEGSLPNEHVSIGYVDDENQNVKYSNECITEPRGNKKAKCFISEESNLQSKSFTNKIKSIKSLNIENSLEKGETCVYSCENISKKENHMI